MGADLYGLAALLYSSLLGADFADAPYLGSTQSQSIPSLDDGLGSL